MLIVLAGAVSLPNALYGPIGISPMGNSGCFSPGKSWLQQSRATQPVVHSWCFSVSIIH